MDIENLYERVSNYVTSKRLEHIFGVMKTAGELAERYGADKRKAEIAGLLHDVARDLELKEMISLCKEKYDDLDEFKKKNKFLLHACAGRVLVEKEFGINDPDILSAIEKHTTGSKNMSLIDKIIFVSDYIEPSRSFRGVKKARLLARKNLDRTMLYIYQSVLIYLLRELKYICIETLEGYNSVLMSLSNPNI